MARDISIAFGERVRQLRSRRGWRQIDLAESAGISENYVSDLESGKKEVCLRTIQAIAKSFGMKIKDLMDGTE